MLLFLGQGTHSSLTGHRRPGVRKGVRVSPVGRYQEDSSCKRSQAPCLLPIRVLRDASTSPRKTDTTGPCTTPLVCLLCALNKGLIKNNNNNNNKNLDPKTKLRRVPMRLTVLIKKNNQSNPEPIFLPLGNLLSVYHLWFPTWPLQHFWGLQQIGFAILLVEFNLF